MFNIFCDINNSVNLLQYFDNRDGKQRVGLNSFKNQERGLVDSKLVKTLPTPSIFIAGCPKATLLF